MPSSFDWEIDGLDELMEVTRTLPDVMQERVEKSMLRAGATIVRKESQRLVGVDEGDLHDAITARLMPRRYRNTVLARVGVKGAENKLAHIHEDGTDFRVQETTGRETGISRPNPFLRPALANKAREVLEKMRAAWLKGLERETKKLVGPLSKSGLYRKRSGRRRKKR